MTTWHNSRELERINGGVTHNGQQTVAHPRVLWLVGSQCTSAGHFTSSIKGTKALRYVIFEMQDLLSRILLMGFACLCMLAALRTT